MAFPVSQHQVTRYCRSLQTWQRLLRCSRHSGLGPVLTAPTRPPQPHPPTGLCRDPHARPSPAQLRLASQAPRTETQPATAAAAGGTSAYPAAAAAILAHPAPVAAAADVSDGYVSARHAPGSPRLSPSSSLSLPHPLYPAPTVLPPWPCSELVRLRRDLATPPFGSAPSLVPFFAPSSFCPAPWSPRPFPLASPFRLAPLDSAPRSPPVFRCLIPSSHPIGLAPSRQSCTAPPPWPRPSPTCRVQSAGPASRRRPGYAGSVPQTSCFWI